MLKEAQYVIKHTSPTLAECNQYGGVIRRTVKIHIIVTQSPLFFTAKITRLNKLTEGLLNKCFH
jgi:hypothetical protein